MLTVTTVGLCLEHLLDVVTIGGSVGGSSRQALDTLRSALDGVGDPIHVDLTLPRLVAEKVLHLLEAEVGAGAVVVPVQAQYTTTQAAAMLGISRATLMKLIDAGEIDAVKVGTHHRVAAEELVAYQRSVQTSQARAAELMTEFSGRTARFQSNVTFQTDPMGEE